MIIYIYFIFINSYNSKKEENWEKDEAKSFPNTIKKKAKKVKPTIQLAMARSEEGTNTAYVPVTNASPIVTIAPKMRMKARTTSFMRCFSSLIFLSKRNGINR